jgi:hypothetical protein
MSPAHAANTDNSLCKRITWCSILRAAKNMSWDYGKRKSSYCRFFQKITSARIVFFHINQFISKIDIILKQASGNRLPAYGY